MMMLIALRRRIVVVVIICTTQYRVVRATVCNATMTQGHMPGGKEPAKQGQQSKDSTE